MQAVTKLIQTHLQGREWTARTLAATLTPHNPRKTLGKLLALLEGRNLPTLLDAVCGVLQVSQAERKAAEVEDQWAYRLFVLEQQRKRFRPHVWTETTLGFQRPLFMGADLFRRTELPAALLALEDEGEIIARVGQFVAAHFQSSALRVGKVEVQNFLYRKQFDLAYRFSPTGNFVTKVDRPIIAPEYSLVIR